MGEPMSDSKACSEDEVRIAMATIRTVAEHGAERVTTAEVAKELGMTRAELLQRCPSEADLWRITGAVIVRQMTHSWNAVCALEEKPAERLRALLAAQIRLVTATPALRDILFSRKLQQSQLALRREVANARKQLLGLIARTLREAVAAGDLPRSLDPDRTAQAVMETLQGVVLSWSLAFVTEINLEEVWSRVETLLRRPADEPTRFAANGQAH